MMNWRKTLLEKGNTLTRIEATSSIGKTHETTKQEVQENRSIHASSQDKPKKALVWNYSTNKKGSHSFLNRILYPAWRAVCRQCKIKNHFQVSKECKRSQKERQAKPTNQKQSRSAKKSFVLKVEEVDEEHHDDVANKMCPKATLWPRESFCNSLLDPI